MNYSIITACQVVYEMDYSRRAIIQCYVPGISAADLVMKILDLEDIDQSFREDTEEAKCIYEGRHSLNELREETMQLWKRQFCHKCWKNPSNMLALPCTHLVICDKCKSNSCIVCGEMILDLIKVHI